MEGASASIVVDSHYRLQLRKNDFLLFLTESRYLRHNNTTLHCGNGGAYGVTTTLAKGFDALAELLAIHRIWDGGI